MPTMIDIYSSLPLKDGRGGLEDDIQEALGDAVRVTGGGGGWHGWNIDLMLADDSDADATLRRLLAFLRNWGVPQDTYLNVFPPDRTEGQPPSRIPVFADETPGGVEDAS